MAQFTDYKCDAKDCRKTRSAGNHWFKVIHSSDPILIIAPLDTPVPAWIPDVFREKHFCGQEHALNYISSQMAGAVSFATVSNVGRFEQD